MKVFDFISKMCLRVVLFVVTFPICLFWVPFAAFLDRRSVDKYPSRLRLLFYLYDWMSFVWHTRFVSDEVTLLRRDAYDQMSDDMAAVYANIRRLCRADPKNADYDRMMRLMRLHLKTLNIFSEDC